MTFKAMKVDEMAKGLSVDSEEKMLEDLSLSAPLFRGQGYGEETAKDTRRSSY